MNHFNPERLVAIGEGLAAGFGAFSLYRTSQRHSFPALIARQLGVPFPQPLFEPPGIGNCPGFEPQPVILPGISQATVFDSLPPVEPANLSVPGFTLADALGRRPCQPMIVRDDALQTACNLIIGARRVATNSDLLTQVESAARLQPTGVLVALGYTEALSAAITGSVEELPTPEQFGTLYSRLSTALAPATLLLFTVPNPFDVPFFMDPAHAASILRVEEGWLREHCGLLEGDFLKLPAVHEIGFQIFARSLTGLASDAKVSSVAASEISARIVSWNAQIRKIALERGALLYDLNEFLNRLHTDGFPVGSTHLSADYLGGLYSLNGCYPGHVGHGAIANEVLALLRQPPIDLDELLVRDPAAQAERAQGDLWTRAQLAQFTKTSGAGRPTAKSSLPRGTSLPRLAALSHSPLAQRLNLPSDFKQELPLDVHGSYFGDGISANHCEDATDAQYGGGGFSLFGGLALVDSHLSGKLRFEFTPISADRASFRLYFEGLVGNDSVLTTPVMFRMPFQQCGVTAYPEPFRVSTGEVDLTTGDVSRLRVYASFQAKALQTLVECNKDFPSTPLSFLTLDVAESALEYSSAWAKFEQREDGKLDFTFYGTRFVPLGPGARWPLNFAGPDGKHTVIPASGSVMHPHLRLTTKPTPASFETGHAASQLSSSELPLPESSVRELTFHTHNTAFGDGFDLRVPELGGPSTGRAHILGRVSVQFGVASGGTIPVAVRNLPPGGIFSQPPLSPISDAFPVRVAPGPKGFDQRLRYPRATLTMEDISIPDDPFDIAMGAVDTETGFLFSDHLHRGFIEQDIINALMRIESRVRHTSFFFRGPGVFAFTDSDALMFRFLGDEILPYPAGLAYPQPDFTSSYYAGLGATLNPYFWIRAVEDFPARDYVAEGSYTNVVAAATRDQFSFDYRIPANPSKDGFYFHFRNDTQLGAFNLHSLSWVGFGNSAGAKGTTRGFDTLTFSGFGIWEKNTVSSLEQVAVQIWNKPGDSTAPYIGIQIASGSICNVDTRPVDPNEAHP